MSQKNSQWRFWLIAAIFFALTVWILKPVLFPFVAGMAIAYFLNPVVETLGRRNVPRWLSTTWVLTAFALFVTVIVMLTAPLIQEQVANLINALPGYIQKLRDMFMPWFENWTSRFAPEDVEKVRDAATQSAGEATTWLVGILSGILSGGGAILNIAAFAVITPIVAFYMMQDWPRITRSIDELFPRRYYEVIHARLAEIDSALSGFVRGQALVCLSLMFVYGLGLTLTGLEYGATIGLIAGVLSFIPYVGTTFGWVVSLILAIIQFEGDALRILLVLAVFGVGQVLETYILTPRLVGQRVGLHPVWILFAIMTGGKLLGFFGVLIAVPVAAVIGVMIRFAVKQYKASAVYKDSL